MKKKLLRILGWAVLAASALFFLVSGARKLAGDEMMVAMFQELGYPDGFRYAVGAAEAVGAILLLVPRTTLLAAAGLAVLMLGAAVSELSAGRPFEAGIAAQWLVLFIIVVIVKLRGRRKR